MAKKNMHTKTPFKKYTNWLWFLFFGGLFLLFLTFFLASQGVFGKLPTFEELENPESNLATEVISIDGKTLGKYYRENRTPIQYKELPSSIVKALVATEDERFYKHSGIDIRGTLRAVSKLGKGGGASTITQQLAKMLFTKRASSNIAKRILQKIKEWIIAVRLERHYTKNEIITMYLNKYDFLNLAVGIRSAARIYFGKEPKDLDIQQSAMLVGMLKNASYFNPLRRPKKVLGRRNQVLIQMVRNNFITTREKDSLQKLPLGINLHREDTSDGIATYFREYLREFMKGWLKKHPKPDGSSYNLYRDGLKIYVTIDSRMQRYAEEAVREHISNLQKSLFKQLKSNPTAPFVDLEPDVINTILNRAIKNSTRYKKLKLQGATSKEIQHSFRTKNEMKVFSWHGIRDTLMTPLDSIKYYKSFLQAGLLSIEPQTGQVKAWVGGIDYKYFQYDHVKQSKRQVGSTFKPFVYATAINQLRLSPCQKFPNTPFTIPKGRFGIPEDWTPRNAGNKYGGMLTLKQALAKSINAITARIMNMVTPKNVVRLARNLGITSPIPEVPSIALGSVDLSLYEMVGAYSTFANKGMYIKPMMVLKIEDKNGTILEQFKPKTREVLNKEAAYVVINLLEGVTQYGSGIRLRTTGGVYPDNVSTGYPYEFTNPIAGKTGTTQNQSDGWFMGIVPNLATGVWVGATDRSVHFTDIARGQGASMALPIWALYLKKCYADSSLHISDGNFERPDKISIDLNCNTNTTIFQTQSKDSIPVKVISKEDPEF